MGRVLKLSKAQLTWEEALQEFIWFKQAQGIAPRTLKDYQDFVRQFFQRYPDLDYTRPHDLKRAVYEYMAQEGIKPATFNLRLTYLGAFFSWCLGEGHIQENPLAGIKRRKAESRIVNHDLDTLTRLLEAPDKSTFAGLRDYALILLTLDTGIRPGEAFQLLPCHINLHSREVTVPAAVAKTRTSRTLPVSPVTIQAIHDLLKARHPAWGDSVPVFCTTEGTSLNRNSWRGRLELYSKKIGRHIRPYDLRHIFALQYLRNQGNALTLQRTLGHTDLSMTKRYVALTQEDLREQHAIASPVAQFIPQRNRVRKAILDRAKDPKGGSK